MPRWPVLHLPHRQNHLPHPGVAHRYIHYSLRRLVLPPSLRHVIRLFHHVLIRLFHHGIIRLWYIPEQTNPHPLPHGGDHLQHWPGCPPVPPFQANHESSPTLLLPLVPAWPSTPLYPPDAHPAPTGSYQKHITCCINKAPSPSPSASSDLYRQPQFSCSFISHLSSFHLHWISSSLSHHNIKDSSFIQSKYNLPERSFAAQEGSRSET